MRRSKSTLIHLPLELKFWIDGAPDVALVRPTRCARCEAPSRSVAGALTVIGHGVRTRQLRGPLAPGGPALELLVHARRFLCRACRAVMTVVPEVVAQGRWYSAAAIIWALALFGLCGQTAAAVRARVQPAAAGSGGPGSGWRQLARWVDVLGGAQASRDGRRGIAASLAVRAAAQAGPTVELDAEAAWTAAMMGYWRWPREN